MGKVPVRKRFKHKKRHCRPQSQGGTHAQRSNSTMERTGLTVEESSTVERTESTVSAVESSQSNNTSFPASSSGPSVLESAGFHDYTSRLSPPVEGACIEMPSQQMTPSPLQFAVPADPLPVTLSAKPINPPSSLAPQDTPNLMKEVGQFVEFFLYRGWVVMLQRDAIHVVLMSTEPSLIIQRDLIFSPSGKVEIYVHGKPVNVAPFLENVPSAVALTLNTYKDFVNRIVTIVNAVRVMEVCSGYDDERFREVWKNCPFGEIDKNSHQESRYQETFRSQLCLRLVKRTKWRCVECQKLYGPLKRRAEMANKEEPDMHIGNKYLTEEQKLRKLREQHKEIENARKKIKHQEEKIQALLKDEGVCIDQKLSEDLTNLLDNGTLTPAQRVFLDQQVKASQTKDKRGMRWHPTMIRLALAIHVTSPSAYETLRDSGMIKLPSGRTLFDYGRAKPIQEGIDESVLESIADRIDKLKNSYQKYHVLMADEMQISQNLLVQKSTGTLVGYTKLDKVDQEIRILEQYLSDSDEEMAECVATKVLVYMVKGVSSGIKEVITTYSVGKLSVNQIYMWTWQVIGALERSGVAVIAFISDGCSVNRAFIKRNTPVTIADSGVVFDTINKGARHRILYFISDVPHLLKTIRNCLMSSRSDKSGKRTMVRAGKMISWDFILRLYNSKKEKNLRKSFKLNVMNIFPDSYSRMKVKYAAEVLSRTVAQDLEDQGWTDASGTIFFIRFVNDWFDCLNGAHTIVGKKKRNKNLAPYVSTDDERFEFLLSFLKYLDDWKEEANTANKSAVSSRTTECPGNVATTGNENISLISEEEMEDVGDETPASKKMLSRQTLEGIEMTTRAFIPMVKFLLQEGTQFINARIFTQDPLEQHFSKIRAGQGGSNNPNVGQVLNRNRAIHTIGQLGIKRRKGNTGEAETHVEVTTEPLPKRKSCRLTK